jgi:hypothetical protein
LNIALAIFLHEDLDLIDSCHLIHSQAGVYFAFFSGDRRSPFFECLAQILHGLPEGVSLGILGHVFGQGYIQMLVKDTSENEFFHRTPFILPQVPDGFNGK